MKNIQTDPMHVKRDELAAEILAVAKVFAETRGIGLAYAATSMGVRYDFFTRIEAGDIPKFYVTTYDTLMLLFSQKWPEGAKWPKGIARPKL